jgi:hypothetical protein
MSTSTPSPENVEAAREAARSAIGALLAYRRGNTSGMRTLTHDYADDPERLVTALFHLANVFADKIGHLEGRSGDDVLRELAQRMGRR